MWSILQVDLDSLKPMQDNHYIQFCTTVIS